MNEEPVAADLGFDLAGELRRIRAILEREVAAARDQVVAAREAEGAMRAQRDQLRHTQVSSEIKLMSLQKELAQVVEKSEKRDERRLTKLESVSQEIVAIRLELGRAADQLAMAEAIARNAQAQVLAYEAAQRSQIVRIADLEQRVRQQTEQAAKVKVAYDAQAREFIRKRKGVEAQLAELAGARSRRFLLKLRLVSRCAWEK